VNVVADKSVTRPLGEETGGNENDEAVTVPFCLPQLSPGIAFEFLFQLKGFSDFLEFQLNNFILLCNKSV
jgi:hypothetical protein